MWRHRAGQIVLNLIRYKRRKNYVKVRLLASHYHARPCCAPRSNCIVTAWRPYYSTSMRQRVTGVFARKLLETPSSGVAISKTIM